MASLAFVDITELASARLRLARENFASHVSSSGARHDLCDVTDAALQQLWADAAGPGDGVALAAVGSLGRQESGPASDLDLVLLHADKKIDDAEVGALTEKLWYPLWDAKLRLDHSVRSFSQCRDVALDDFKAATGLLDIRFIAGDRALVDEVSAAILTDWRKASRKYLPHMVESLAARADRAGELAYMIEPDLKEARGGIRDMTTMLALAATWLVDRPHGAVDEALETVLTVRDALHVISGRPGNRLALAYQDDVAKLAGFDDADAVLAALAQAGRTIAYALDVTVRQVEQSQRRPGVSQPFIVRGRRAAPKLTSIAHGLALLNGEIVLTGQVNPQEDPLLALRAASYATTHHVTMAASLVERFATAAPLPQPWPAEALALFVDCLAAGEDQIPVWEALDQAGLTIRWIPQWADVRNQPQRNVLHRFTVDRHMIQTVVEASAALKGAPPVAHSRTLLLAALLHDIGKRPGEAAHAAAGAAIAPAILARMGVPGDESHDVVTLIREHLTLADLATKNDPEDPDTVTSLMNALENRKDLLELLRVLTEADALAAGPQAWTPLRRTLIDQLFRAALARCA